MPIFLLTRTERWRRSDLATRIALLSGLLTALVLLPMLLLAYAALHSFLHDKMASELEVFGIETRLRFESRLAGSVEKVRSAATQTIFSNALADSSERTLYIRPILRDLCAATPELRVLKFTDFRGETLEYGCNGSGMAEDKRRRLSTEAIAAGLPRLELGSSPPQPGADPEQRLSVAAPIIYLPTNSHEGSLVAEINLSAVFQTLDLHPPSTYRVALRSLPETASHSDTLDSGDDQLRFTTFVTPQLGHSLPLAIEVEVSGDSAYLPLYRLLVGFVGICAVVLALVWWQSRSIAKIIAAPLAELERTAQRVAAGQLDDIPQRPLEPGEQDSFRLLEAAVYRMIAALRDTQLRLTQTLDDRTQRMERAEADRHLKEHALASTDSGILILDHAETESEHIRYANAAFLSITGLGTASVIGAHWPALLNRHLPAPTGDTALAARHAGDNEELEWLRPDGSRAYLQLSRSDFHGDHVASGRHTIVVVTDVTRRVQAARAYRARLDSLREAVFEVDLEGHCIFLNETWTRITGYSIAESLGRRLTELIHPADTARHRPALDALLEHRIEHHEFETRARCADGSTRWLWMDVALKTNDAGHAVGFAGTLSDVTANHDARLAIEIRDRALEAASNGIIITDLQQPDNPIIHVNPAFERITGYTAAEVLGLNCRLLRPAGPDSPSVAQLRNAIADRKACSVVLRNVRKDGTEFWNQLSISPVSHPVTGEITHYVGIQTDITEARAAEDLLIDWLERLDVVFTLSPDPLICFDDRGQVVYANAAAERVFGTTMGALIGLTVTEFEAQLRAQCDPAYAYPGLPAHMHARSADNQADATDPAKDCNVHLLKPKNITLHQTYRFCGGESTSLIVYYRDITREAELDRMKSDFLSTAAHELRTPMASIVGFSELLLMRRYDEERTRDLLGTINRQAQRLSAMLGDLLDLARIEARRAEIFNFATLAVPELLDETIKAFMVPDPRYRLIVDMPVPPPNIRADRDKFQQALLNLLSNACKFSPEGGDITIHVIPPTPGEHDQVGIAVEDHGIGMNADECQRAFERFYRTDRSGHIPGTGLGLSLVKEIMKIHGGAVTLNSAPNLGTTVTLWFPLDLDHSDTHNAGASLTASATPHMTSPTDLTQRSPA